MKKPALAVIAPLALIGCGSDKSGTFDDGEGGEGSYSVEQKDGETTATVTTRDGTATMRSGADVPLELPSGFTLYPGAKVENNTSFSAGSGKGALINMTSGDSPQKMVDFYRKQAKAAGFEITMDAKMGDQIAIVGEHDDSRGFTFNASPSDGGSTAQLMIGEGMN